jgi:hypothetical protein
LEFGFTYITKTAYTWKGPIEEAVFQFDSKGLLKYLETTPLLNSPSPGRLPISRPVFLVNNFPSVFEKNDGVYKWVFKGKVPEEGLSVSFLALLLPSKESEMHSFVNASLAKLKDVTADEYRSVLKQYYVMLVKLTKPASQFLSEYFKDIRIINDKTQFMLESDRKSVAAIAGKYDALTR